MMSILSTQGCYLNHDKKSFIARIDFFTYKLREKLIKSKYKKY